MRTKNMPPETPKSWARRGIDSVKESRLAVQTLGVLALAASALGFSSVVVGAANDFNEANQQTTCRAFEVSMDFSQDGIITTSYPRGESIEEIQEFLDGQPGNHRADDFFWSRVGIENDQKVKVCVTDAPLSGSEVFVSEVDSLTDQIGK